MTGVGPWLSRFPGFLDEFMAVHYDLIRRLEEITPDTCRLDQIRERPPECFDRQPAIVAAGLDRLKDIWEIDVTASRYAAIASAGLYSRSYISPSM